MKRPLMIGEYKVFDKEPTEAQIRKTLMRLGKRLASWLKRKGYKPSEFNFEHIIREDELLFTQWTVATKATQKR